MADMEQKTLVEINNSVREPHTGTTQFDIKSMIYVVRNQQVVIRQINSHSISHVKSD